MSTAVPLRGEALCRGFGEAGTRTEVLRGLDLEIPAGQITVVTGRSGAGKTTLVNLLSGLDRPDSGRVVLDGEDLHLLPEPELLEIRRRRLGLVFQDFGLIPVLTAAENIEVPLRLLSAPTGERTERVRELLDRMGLARHGGHRPGELSGGQQQRVGIARALAASPGIILADEPTAQLDADTAASVMDLIRELTFEQGLATLVTTHDPLVVERADRVLELHHQANRPA